MGPSFAKLRRFRCWQVVTAWLKFANPIYKGFQIFLSTCSAKFVFSHYSVFSCPMVLVCLFLEGLVQMSSLKRRANLAGAFSAQFLLQPCNYKDKSPIEYNWQILTNFYCFQTCLKTITIFILYRDFLQKMKVKPTHSNLGHLDQFLSRRF